MKRYEVRRVGINGSDYSIGWHRWAFVARIRARWVYGYVKAAPPSSPTG